MDGADFVAAKELQGSRSMARIYADTHDGFVLDVNEGTILAGIGDGERNAAPVLGVSFDKVANEAIVGGDKSLLFHNTKLRLNTDIKKDVRNGGYVLNVNACRGLRAAHGG